jgi:hypothetical protein
MFRVYVKYQGRFHAFDMDKCVPVANLINATIYEDSVMDELQRDLESNNKGVTFQFRGDADRIIKEFEGK